MRKRKMLANSYRNHLYPPCYSRLTDTEVKDGNSKVNGREERGLSFWDSQCQSLFVQTFIFFYFFIFYKNAQNIKANGASHHISSAIVFLSSQNCEQLAAFMS